MKLVVSKRLSNRYFPGLAIGRERSKSLIDR
jgi:hypothetical protein